MVTIFKKLMGIRKETVDTTNINLNEAEEIDDENNNVDMQDEKIEEYDDENNDIIEDENEDDEKWLEKEEEGQLSIDVYQTAKSIIVKSTIAGVKSNDIDISINNDMLTIRGKRQMTEEIKTENYLFKECYWGSFSRSIILPVEIIPEKIDASLENGILTIILPKAKIARQISIKVKEK